MITEINQERKVHSVGPYYTNISRCMVHRMSSGHISLSLTMASLTFIREVTCMAL